MRLLELFEAGNSHVTFVFGRMNPPTIGHKQLLDAASQVGGDYYIFLSQTQDKKKNPLDYATKIKFIKQMFPDHAGHVVDNPNLNTIVKVASYLYEQGYRNATFVAGSDRLEDMKKLLSSYNGVEGKSHGFYKFEMLDFKSSGDREDGAEGVAGVSASNAREAAAAGDIDRFAESTGAGKYTQELYNAVRAGMGISESATVEGIHDDEYAQQIARAFIQKAKIGRHTADDGTIMRMLSKFFEKFGISDHYFDNVYHKISTIAGNDQPTENTTRI